MNRKVVFSIEGDESGSVFQANAVEHEGEWWFAPKALEPPTGIQTAQLLLVRPQAGIRWQSPDSQMSALRAAVPKAVLDGAPSPGWVVTWMTVRSRLSPANPSLH